MPQVLEWFEGHIAFSATVFVVSLVALVASLWGVHWFLVSVPPHYFSERHERLDPWRDSHPALRWTVLIGKNLLGVLLALAGIIMLFTPGQGVLTLLLGISLLDLPGKRAFERWIIQREAVLKVVNQMRHRAGSQPLEF